MSLNMDEGTLRGGSGGGSCAVYYLSELITRHVRM